jgi:hypothetical protein
LLSQPKRCPANKIGSEQHEILLQLDGRFGVDLDVEQKENLLGLPQEVYLVLAAESSEPS